MRNAKNKHGPDIDIGIRMGWPRGPAIITGEPPPGMKIRYGPSDSVDSRIDTNEFTRGPDTVRPEEIPKGVKRTLWQSRVPIAIGIGIITRRRPDESPSCFGNNKNIKHIDSKARNDLPVSRCLKHGVLKDNCCLNGSTMPLKEVKNARREAMTRRHATMNFRVLPRNDAMTQNNVRIDSLQVNHHIVEGRKSEVSNQRSEVRGQKSEVRFRNLTLVPSRTYGIRKKFSFFFLLVSQSPCTLVLFQSERQRSIGAVVPRPFFASLVPFRTTMNLLIN